MRFPFYKRKEDRTITDFLTWREILAKMSSDEVRELTIQAQTDKSAKGKLPCVTWQCTNEGRNRTEGQHQTGFYMVDIDHVEKPGQAYSEIVANPLADLGVALIHKTPSGKGLRLVAAYREDFPTILEHQKWLVEKLNLTKYGDFDEVCHDMSRLSFLPASEYIYYADQQIFNNDEALKKPIEEAPSNLPPKGRLKKAASQLGKIDVEKLSQTKYKDYFLTDIVTRYVREQGAPEEGNRHSFYVELAKCFRQLCDNNAEVLFSILPEFTLSDDERWKVCQFATSRNTSSRYPKDFYFFLVKNGYIQQAGSKNLRAREATVEEVFNTPEQPKITLPKLPPIFNEFARIAPEDFKLPVIYSLMPVLGTLTTNYYTEYWDGEEQTTTFMNIIFAPPASGKSFSDRVYNILTEKMRLRDDLNIARMLLFDKFNVTKGANDKGQAEPATVLRISQAITSMVQLLTEQKKAQGRHQLVYVHELDTWAKGSKSGGGDKSDLFRVMWENGTYGQNYKSSNTFRGSVRLFLNALITSTPGQIHNYFKDVENGLVTRFSFCEVRNQRFALPQIWKKLTQQENAKIHKIMDRLDSELYYNDYEEYKGDVPIDRLTQEEFDKEVKWQTQFKPKQFVSTEEFHPVIIEWLKKQLQQSSRELDDARDTWRRRTGTKMCRLALMCKVLYDKPTAKDIELIKKFIVWWGDMEMRESLDLWGEAFNEKQRAQNKKIMPQQSLFDRLPEVFTKEDVLREANVLNVKTEWRVIKSLWTKQKCIKEEYNRETKTSVFTKIIAAQ